MGERRLRLASALLRSILSCHSFRPGLLQSSAISLHLENRVSLLQTFGSYILTDQRSELAEGRQAQFWIQPTLSFMGTVSAEVPIDVVLEKTSELSTINGDENAPVKAEEESAKETLELLAEKKTHEDYNAQNIAKLSTFNEEENTQVKTQEENASTELSTEKKMLEDNDIQNAIASLSLQAENGFVHEVKKLHVVFVLGGPGSGKGTQCAKIVENFGFIHLSAGDLLRAEIKSGSENGTMIQNMIKEGKIVPSEVTVKLLQRAMQENENDKFLIDGFPRNEENRAAFENVTGIEPDFILFFDCPEEEMERRLLNRNEGRVDDNIETIRKRFKVFVESSLPVVGYYDLKGKVRKIDAARAKEDIFEHIKALFLPYIQETSVVKREDN